MLQELFEIEELLVRLSKRRNEILDAIYPVQDDDDWQEKLADAYENAKKDYKFPKVA